tara:strand:+ start:298 stop:498 length:201 start_codon:yes stop_codon:yes gene_type:complete
MTRQEKDFINQIEHLENVVFVCFGRPQGAELPQVLSEQDVVVDLIQRRSGQPLETVKSDINHQFTE